MAGNSFDSLVKATPNGAKILLDSVYVYASGSGYFLGQDGSNHPVKDAYEMIEQFVRLVGIAQHKAELIAKMKRQNEPANPVAQPQTGPRTTSMPTPRTTSIPTPVATAVGTPTASPVGTPTATPVGTPTASPVGTPVVMKAFELRLDLHSYAPTPFSAQWREFQHSFDSFEANRFLRTEVAIDADLRGASVRMAGSAEDSAIEIVKRHATAIPGTQLAGLGQFDVHVVSATVITSVPTMS